LKKLLRQEWGFKGMVVSDWASVGELIPHGIAADEKEAATKSINAGLEMEMVSSFYIKHMKELIKEGVVKEEEINQAVRNILRVKFILGLFENPYVDVSAKSSLYSSEHLEKAKEIATQSLVLLKNSNNTLPIKQSVKSIAVIGPMADAPYDQMGTWVLDGDETHTQTPLKALKEAYSDKIKIIYEKGLSYSRDNNKSDFAKAIAASRGADVTIFFAGEESILSGEARCRADISLPGAQSQLIEELKKTGKPLIIVVMAGRPLTIEKECALSDALLYAWHPGTMGGPAIADVLFGKAIPSGKLPITFPKAVGQIPIYYAHKNTGRPPREPLDNINSIPVGAKQFSIGNTSYYLDAGAKPLFPFGYGLSYTTFSYSDLKLSKSKMNINDSLIVTCEIKNTGNYEADEIVQLYIRDLVGSITRPVKELKSFKRISLKPGEANTVSFTIGPKDLSFWNNQSKVIEKGKFNVWIAPDSDSGPMAEFELTD
jgi:beta-glucosidase